jgi:hypothetical protein
LIEASAAAEALFLEGSMVRITISERDSFGAERMISTRTFDVESKKRLTQGRARKILTREHPELGSLILLVKRGPGFVAIKATLPTEKCSFHFIWRDYYIADE